MKKAKLLSTIMAAAMISTSFPATASAASLETAAPQEEAIAADSAISFNDVRSKDYFYNPVAWAVENNITRGTSGSLFSPKKPCTRAQIVTFLWNLAGKPAAASTAEFEDVSADAYYADAVNWAVSKGITKGISDWEFAPDNPCTRAQAVTFIYSYAGNPKTTATTDFTDVRSTAWYAKPVAWAVENGITSGTSAAKFSPNSSCTRGQIMTFLYKYVNPSKGNEPVPEDTAWKEAYLNYLDEEGIPDGEASYHYYKILNVDSDSIPEIRIHDNKHSDRIISYKNGRVVMLDGTDYDCYYNSSLGLLHHHEDYKGSINDELYQLTSNGFITLGKGYMHYEYWGYDGKTKGTFYEGEFDGKKVNSTKEYKNALNSLLKKYHFDSSEATYAPVDYDDGIVFSTGKDLRKAIRDY